MWGLGVGFWDLRRIYCDARHHSSRVRRLQASQVQHDEEQEEDDRAAGVQQVLPLLSQAHGAQGNQVVGWMVGGRWWFVDQTCEQRPRTTIHQPPSTNQVQVSSSIGRASVSKTE